MCNWRYRARVHSLKSGRTRCKNKEVTAPIFENKIWNIIETTMTNPDELRKKIPDIQGKQQNAQLRLKRRLIKIDKDMLSINKKKEKIIYLYTSKNLDHSMYVKENSKLDEELKKLGLEKIEIVRNTPVLFNEDVIDYSIKQYCENVRLRYERCVDFETKRKFCLDFINEIVHEGDYIVLRGSVPLLQEGEKSKLEFKVERVITYADRFRPNSGCFKPGVCAYRPFKHLRKTEVIK